MKNMHTLGFMVTSISIYREILEDDVVKKLEQISCIDMDTPNEVTAIYSEMFNLLCKSPFKGNLYDYIYDKVIYAENLFTLECSKGKFDELPSYIVDAVKSDLDVLYKIANISSDNIKNFISKKFPEVSELSNYMPNFENIPKKFKDFGNWGENINHFVEYNQNSGYGVYSRHNFFYLDSEDLILKPVVNPDDINIFKLKGYEVPRQIIIDNTKALLNGVKANNILLYGHRGTGKSSTIKAIVNEYSKDGLRLIEISKENLKHLGKVIDLLANIPMKFIVFVDDLTFTDGDDSYTALKAVLEGSSNKLGDNMALYATTNRRHMITETFSSREGDEVHLKDTLDEAASLSDRFGIIVTYSFPNRKEYLAIVEKLGVDYNLKTSKEDLEAGAIVWSSKKGSFSPRTARQYIDYIISKEFEQNKN